MHFIPVRLLAFGGPGPRKATLGRLVVAIALLAVFVGFATGGLDVLDALKAAGLNGTPPPGASAFQTLITTLTANATWLIATGVGLVLTLVSLAHGMGSQRTPDHLFRVAGAIAVVLIGIPALLA
jgi:hypothetical protein